MPAPQIVAPGDVVMVLPDGGRVAIGAGGLRPAGGAIVASKAGVVRRSRGGQLWVEGRQKRCAGGGGRGPRGEGMSRSPRSARRARLASAAGAAGWRGAREFQAASASLCAARPPPPPPPPPASRPQPPRYIPSEGDCVVGVIVDRMGEVGRGGHGRAARGLGHEGSLVRCSLYQPQTRLTPRLPSHTLSPPAPLHPNHPQHFTVDIGGPFKAVLPMLSFEGATKRNRPQIFEGDVVAARVVAAHPDMDPQLSCVDATGAAAGYGHLKGGLVFEVSCAWARALLGRPPPPVLLALGAEAPFELSVGLNGRVWVDAPGAAVAARVAGALAAAERELRPGDDAGAFARRALAGAGGGGGGGAMDAD
jgi:exosome complex RNA-binding protein Rrp4